MRTKELKPGVKYATEAGTCVETYPEVERGWYRYRETANGKKEKQVVRKGLPGEPPESDPWGDQSSRRSTVRLHDRVLRDIVEGVRVTVYHVDGEGNATGSFESVVDPKHIKGTWEDYVRLHGDSLKSAQFKREAEEAAKAESLRLKDKLKQAGLTGENVNVTVQVLYLLDDPRHKGDLRESAWLNRGQIARGYRLQPTLTLANEAVESALDGIIFDGH